MFCGAVSGQCEIFQQFAVALVMRSLVAEVGAECGMHLHVTTGNERNDMSGASSRRRAGWEIMTTVTHQTQFRRARSLRICKRRRQGSARQSASRTSPVERKMFRWSGFGKTSTFCPRRLRRLLNVRWRSIWSTLGVVVKLGWGAF